MGIIRNYHSGMCFVIPYVGHMAQLSNPEKKRKMLKPGQSYHRVGEIPQSFLR